ncbi:hypothetical protein L0E60_29425, partial [Klebsiella pneumoniae]|nr:hypothetical protein [Klebsiella pneumoniae]MCF0526319.1 hypothetical protein [Klebsiella pneumoniae]MCF0591403.1 hypothetical protein [Klebsiella pneumoniae]MCF0602866.1 hypothetical protein [Klebsiella pneumoniae]MCF0625076.1 hypothetical protein [Klebsiella pneumoniae]
YGPQNDVTLKMPAFEWVHVQLHQQKGMISLSPPTICNSAYNTTPYEQEYFHGKASSQFRPRGLPASQLSI